MVQKKQQRCKRWIIDSDGKRVLVREEPGFLESLFGDDTNESDAPDADDDQNEADKAAKVVDISDLLAGDLAKKTQEERRMEMKEKLADVERQRQRTNNPEAPKAESELEALLKSQSNLDNKVQAALAKEIESVNDEMEVLEVTP